MSKSRMPLYLGLTAAGAGGYYLYRAGGDVQGAKKEMKVDAEKAREKMPRGREAEKYGGEVGKEAGATVDEAIDNARSKFKLDERIPEIKENGKATMDEIRQDARDAREKIHESIDKADRTVEQKAAEAKGTVSGWFGKK